MYSRLICFIDKHKILSPAQYGFRKNHSTQHAIIDIVDKICKNMESKKFTCGIFIDLKKAFDTVDHSILLSKLNHYGIRGLIHDWFNSYLSDRSPTTSIGNCVSEVISCSYGVPQGSVLGLYYCFSFTLTIYHPLLTNLNFVYLLMILVCYTLIVTFMHLSVS